MQPVSHLLKEKFRENYLILSLFTPASLRLKRRPQYSTIPLVFAILLCMRIAHALINQFPSRAQLN